MVERPSDLRNILDRVPLAEAPCHFNYLGQVGTVTYKGKTYDFPLWPPYKMPPIKMYPRDNALDYWLLIANHWTHPCFIDESYPCNFAAGVGFICVQCGVRAIIPAHSFVSLHLHTSVKEAFEEIKLRQELFEFHRLTSMGLVVQDLLAKRLMQIEMKDPVLDAWDR